MMTQRVGEKNISIVHGPPCSPKAQYRKCIRLNSGNPRSEGTEGAMITPGQLTLKML